MIKIYNANSTFGNIILSDFISFDTAGRYETGVHGFGTVINNNLDLLEVNYELATLESYFKYLKSIDSNDGFIKYYLLAPHNYKTIKKEYSKIEKTEENYDKYCLNEDGIILLTENVILSDYDDKVKKIYGRYPETALYLIEPNASFSMRPGDYISKGENYEVLQSNNLGKRLILSKMNREI